ncbi:MAG: hypothetical protein P8Y97_03320 [Candidatus Lokiarchaeota archaeon]
MWLSISTFNDIKRIYQNKILNWAEKNLKIYSWRLDRNPYKVLISEILLVRTKASQVVQSYNKFLKKYPTINDFYGLKLDEVREIIKPLGLLFRANYIKTISNQIQNEFKGKIPNNFEDLKSLKGIGKYSANAILCFGYGKKRPLVDSNFIRVYKRVFNIFARTKTAKNDKFLWAFAEKILPNMQYIKYNYAILDLGGNICLSRNPKCYLCPVNKICYFFNRD